MPFGMGIEFSGQKELQKVLQEIPVQMRKGVYRKAMTKGAQVVTKAAKRRARKDADTGTLWKSLGHTVSKLGYFGAVGARSGFRRKAPPHRMTKSGFIDPRHYTHLVEFGTTHSKPKPFLRPAVDNNSEKIFAAMRDGISIGLEKETEKLRRKHARRGR